MSIGNLVLHFRRLRGLTQAGLAKRSGITRMRVYRIEADFGRGALAAELQALARALEVSVTELIGESAEAQG